MMGQFKFKTNINCGSCLSKVSPFLNEEKNIENWSVDLQHSDRILTVESNSMIAEDIKQTVKKAGFRAEEVN